MILSFVCTFALVQDSISYETLAKRIPVVLAELEPKLNRKLTTASEFKNEVVILRADKVPAQDLLDRIAEVSVGRWERNGDRLVLKPDEKVRRQQEQDRVSKRVKTVEVLLEKLKKELEPEYNRAFVESSKVLRENLAKVPDNPFIAFRRTPTSRLAIRSLIALGAERLAKIEAGDRLVLSTRPTARQSDIPNREANLALFAREREVYELVMSGDPTKFTIEGASAGMTNWRNTTRVTEGKLDSILIGIGDIAGSRAQIEVTTVLTTWVARTHLLLSNAQGAPLNVSSNEPTTKLAISEQTLALGKILPTTYESPHIVVPSGSPLAAILRDPVKHEPLALGSEVYLDFAKRKNLNLAVLANDGMFGRFADAPPPMNVFEMRNRVYSDWKVSDGWLRMTSLSPVEARRGRDDRTAMAALLKAKEVDLETRAQYVLQRPFGGASGLGARILGLLNPHSTSQTFDKGEDLQRLYATLSREQHQGGQIQASMLTATQRVILNRMVFGSPGRYRMDGQPSGLLDESTTLFPTGLSPDVVFTLGNAKVPALEQVLRLEGGRTHVFEVPAHQAAIELFWEQNPQHVKGNPSGKYLAPAYIESIKHQIVLSSVRDGGIVWFDETDSQDSYGKPSHPNDLSEGIKKEISEHLANYYEMAKRGSPPTRDLTTTSRTGNPPPHR